MVLAKKDKKIIFSFLITLIIILSPLFVWSADLSLVTAKSTYQVGEIIPLKIYLGSQGQASNAVSGVLSYPTNLAEVSSMSKVGSVINMWVTEPAYYNRDGQANFEGVVLNPGFSGAKGLILTVNLKPKAVGTLKLALVSGAILANDGEGTNILKKLGQLNLNIVPAEKVTPPAPKTPTPPKIEPKATTTTSKTIADIVPPEQLSIIEITPLNSYQARFSFSASDKGSGLDYFQFAINDLMVARLSADKNIFETTKLSAGRYNLTISAFDKAGNETQEQISFEIKPELWLGLFALDKVNPLFIGLAILLLLLALIILLFILSLAKRKGQKSLLNSALPQTAFGTHGGSITFTGLAVGAGAVVLMHNGQISAEAGPSPLGSFEFSLEGINPGLHHFSLVAVEALGNPAYTYNYPVMLSAGASIKVSDISLRLPPNFNQKTVENSSKIDINYSEPNV